MLGGDPADLSPYVFVGDALNDAPMFAGFPKSVGVANIRALVGRARRQARFLTERAEGAGLREVVDHLLAQR